MASGPRRLLMVPGRLYFDFESRGPDGTFKIFACPAHRLPQPQDVLLLISKSAPSAWGVATVALFLPVKPSTNCCKWSRLWVLVCVDGVEVPEQSVARYPLKGNAALDHWFYHDEWLGLENFE